ncbi:hypothetical protein L486_01273 [Kwoniella mangroviensis CBS 10435]|uniref:Uncharacterized protein n=1 Tax=Kwoniella mangroviensis CBS 10435 TaxID=1331196 RepID=A0A1B9J1K0_9TREE|nr:hypothetical protein L486_01273 [Kwoniella mangroviensis CBS 10435]
MLSVSPKPPPIPLADLPCDSSSSNIDVTGIEADDEGDTSDDDQGVFLGDHRPDELSLIAKLSASTSASPSPIIHRAQKRDSREFMRRKTLLLSPTTKPNLVTRSVLTELQIRPDNDDSDITSTPSSSPLKQRTCSCPTPSKAQDASDLTLDFAAFNLSSPRPPTNSIHSQSDSAGSDKENMPVKTPEWHRDEAASLEEVVIMGQNDDSDGSEDEVTQLDMGGLRLSDFSDPETGFEDSQSIEPNHYDDADQQESVGNSSVDLLPDGDISSNMDSPLPVARAGPVVIPVLSSHHFTSIRAEIGSPCRDLSPAPIIPVLEPFEDKIRLSQTESPTSLQTLSEPTRTMAFTSTPSRFTPLPPPALVERGAKLLKEATSAKPLKDATLPTKSASRAMAIRNQLDTAYSSRIGALGPPQRSVSSSSSSSSSSSTAMKASSSTSSSSTARATAFPQQSRSVAAPARSLAVPKAAAPVQKKHTVVPLASSTTKILPTTEVLCRPALAAKKTLPAISKPTNKPADKTANPLRPLSSSSIPLKRPAPVTSFARSTNVNTAVISSSITPASRFPTAAPTRPALGVPSRNLHFHPNHQPIPLQAAPIFSVGVAGDTQVMGRPAFRSPAKAGLLKKTLLDKGTPRKLGTPMRFGTPRMVTMSTPSTWSSAPIDDVSAVPPPVSEGPPATATRHATAEAISTASLSSASSPTEPIRGSSADHEEVSVQLAKPPSSPVKSPSPKKKKRPVGRPRKISQPQAVPTVIPVSPKSKPKSTPTPTAGSLMSEKEIKTTTHRNTIRNQVYHCAIDRQIIRQSGPRPPSPTSKIRTTAERNQEEKKNAREARAKRRKGQEVDEQPDKPVVEKLVQHRHPGDESDFETPQIQRPLKKFKSNEDDKKPKFVSFDKGLTVIRDDGSARPSSRSSREESETVTEVKSCLRAKVELDQHGNLHDAHRPIDNLKRTRVVVNAVFYDGEEPVPFSYSPSNGTRSKKKWS